MEKKPCPTTKQRRVKVVWWGEWWYFPLRFFGDGDGANPDGMVDAGRRVVDGPAICKVVRFPEMFTRNMLVLGFLSPLVDCVFLGLVLCYVTAGMFTQHGSKVNFCYDKTQDQGF